MANHPHDSSRPTSSKIKKALAANDMDALYLALTPRQRAFCKEYVVDFNASAAAIRAGYSKNYNDRMAHLLLKNEGVARYTEYLQTSKEAKLVELSPEYLIQRLCEIMNRPGVRTADELRAIEMAMKHHGMFVDRTEITGKDGDAIRIEQQRIDEDAEKFTRLMKQLRDRAIKKDVIID